MCGANQVFDTRSQCSATCLNPDGNNNCGLVSSVEGCFCQNGFVLDTNNNCVDRKSCGCIYPDKSGVLAVFLQTNAYFISYFLFFLIRGFKIGSAYLSKDCTTLNTCTITGLITSQQSCSQNAKCVNNGLTSFSQCVCNSGFSGNGLTCTPG